MVQSLDKYIIALVIVLIDQFTKSTIDGIRNYGAAFGILKGVTSLFIGVSVVVIVLCVYYLNQDFNSRYRQYLYFGLTFILAGAFGNLIDRIAYGYVRDFITIWIWPSFNIADTFTVIGFILIVVFFIFSKNS